MNTRLLIVLLSLIMNTACFVATVDETVDQLDTQNDEYQEIPYNSTHDNDRNICISMQEVIMLDGTIIVIPIICDQLIIDKGRPLPRDPNEQYVPDIEGQELF